MLDPEGKRMRYYTKNVDCTGGSYSGELYLALNEKPGTYQIVVTDAATGRQEKAAVEVKSKEQGKNG